ncbi:DUF7511 domain-containing protein [Halogranum rubrum]|uniref:DUF7511 domain-containing protein n=1 Tax=Halogranum salarium B-1 TaxID=1210908 RepID=J3EV61_9EURY|nr:hypothetical protein HSB1_29200 [Halogranum salarium B-1]
MEIAERDDQFGESGELDEFDAPPVLLASVTACADGDRQCTIYSSGSGSTHRAAMWVSASGNSFVSLAEMC